MNAWHPRRVTATRITVATTGNLTLTMTFVSSAKFCYYGPAFYIYDWLVTLDLEIDYIWFSQWTLSTWIFTASRYATWINMIMQVVPTPNKTVGPFQPITVRFLTNCLKR